MWATLPDLAREAVFRARVLPDLALGAIAISLLVALLSRSLIAIALAVAILYIPAALLLAHPSDDRSWLILWTACAASLLSTAVAYHRRRLAKQARVLAASVVDMRKELSELQTSYEHKLVSRGVNEREREARSVLLVPRADRVTV